MSQTCQDRKSLFDHIVGTREKRRWEINVKRVGGFHVYGRSNWLALVPHRRYLGLESGGHSVRTSMGLPPLCTVGAAEFEPPASGRIAPFSIAMEFDVFSSALPEVAADDVVQLVLLFARRRGRLGDSGPSNHQSSKNRYSHSINHYCLRRRKIIFSNQQQNVSPQR